MHDGGMMMPTPPPSSPSPSSMMSRKRMMMHMSFFWGQNAEILFKGFPGNDDNTGMYVLSLIFVFVLSFLVELLSHSTMITRRNANNDVAASVVKTAMHGLRMGVAYLLMLAIMSFNGGVFIAAVLGHMMGFFCFGTRLLFNKTSRSSDLPPMVC